jgi:hypothetical protein
MLSLVAVAIEKRVATQEVEDERGDGDRRLDLGLAKDLVGQESLVMRGPRSWFQLITVCRSEYVGIM